jgi:hypothetical protein
MCEHPMVFTTPAYLGYGGYLDSEGPAYWEAEWLGEPSDFDLVSCKSMCFILSMVSPGK